MINPKDHMTDQNLPINLGTGTGTTLIIGVLRGMDMTRGIGHTAETEETAHRDTEDLVKETGSLDLPQDTLAEDMTDPERDTNLPLGMVKMIGIAATLGTDPGPEEGETVEEATAGTTGWTSRLIL